MDNCHGNPDAITFFEERLQCSHPEEGIRRFKDRLDPTKTGSKKIRLIPHLLASHLRDNDLKISEFFLIVFHPF